MMPVFTPDLYFFWAGVVVFFALGLGSFATALIYRLPAGESIVKSDKNKTMSRSKCPSCGHKLGMRDLVPIFSWVFSKGKCRYCGERISRIYPLTEALTVLMSLIAFFQYGYSLMTPVLMVLSCIAVTIIVIDARHMIIPNILNIWVLGLGVMALVLAGMDMSGYMLQKLWMAAFLSMFAYAFISWGLRLTFTKIYGREALGLGDVKFFGAAGFWLGIGQLPYFMMVGGMIGVIYALWSRKVTKSAEFPFGPALVITFMTLVLLKKGVFLTIS